jgi:hypothetical protein
VPLVPLHNSNDSNSGFAPTVRSTWTELAGLEEATITHCFDQLLISLRSNWKPPVVPGAGGDAENVVEYKAGSLLAVRLPEYVDGNMDGANLTVLFEPSERASLDTYFHTRNYLVLHVLDNVKSRFVLWKWNERTGSTSGNTWEYVGGEREAHVRGVSASAVDANKSDAIWLTTSSFLRASTLLLVDLSKYGCDGGTSSGQRSALDVLAEAQTELQQLYESSSKSVGSSGREFVLKRLPDQFFAEDYVETQVLSISK